MDLLHSAPDAEAGTDTVNVPQRGAEAGESGFSAPSAIRDTDLTSAAGMQMEAQLYFFPSSQTSLICAQVDSCFSRVW
ncbi:hypothetical protein, partial [Intestinimonas massiliensis (ex Afouda et al. 2020)]|uniref:hypothetical protein n=1 Tax=Intestinimonas massiliensis (ex Afouda et al. 2020) TaxID=1673721 RepID=UPI0034A047A1